MGPTVGVGATRNTTLSGVFLFTNDGRFNADSASRRDMDTFKVEMILISLKHNHYCWFCLRDGVGVGLSLSLSLSLSVFVMS